MPITFGAFFVGSLSIIGLPPAGGSWSKWFLAMGTLEAGQAGLLMVLMLSSLLGLYYLLEVPVKAFFFKPLEDAHHREGIHEAPTASLIAIIITAIMTVGLFVRPDLAFNLMAMVIPGGVQ
jgi:multicomponent Na+:H+ antiporter subunit D